MNKTEIVEHLRELILRSAPDSRQAAPIRQCRDDEILDRIIPFSSLIVLGMVIAVENHFGITVTRDAYQTACRDGVTLERLAEMIVQLQNTKHEKY